MTGIWLGFEELTQPVWYICACPSSKVMVGPMTLSQETAQLSQSIVDVSGNSVTHFWGLSFRLLSVTVI